MSHFLFVCSGTLKLSQTSPDVPNSEVGAHPHKDLPNAHSQQQVTSRSVGLVGFGDFRLLGWVWMNGWRRKRRSRCCLGPVTRGLPGSSIDSRR